MGNLRLFLKERKSVIIPFCVCRAKDDQVPRLRGMPMVTNWRNEIAPHQPPFSTPPAERWRTLIRDLQCEAMRCEPNLAHSQWSNLTLKKY
jgi:hypothetical protein